MGDLSGFTLLPGLIDAHDLLSPEPSQALMAGQCDPVLNTFGRGRADARTLLSGITTCGTLAAFQGVCPQDDPWTRTSANTKSARLLTPHTGAGARTTRPMHWTELSTPSTAGWPASSTVTA